MNRRPGQQAEWWETLDLNTLVQELPKDLLVASKKFGLDRAGALMPQYVEPGKQHLIDPPYWQRLKREFTIIVCTDDPKYEDIRQKLTSGGTDAKAVVVAVISAALGAELGFTAGAVAPFCILCLIALAGVGREALCSGEEWGVVEPEGESER